MAKVYVTKEFEFEAAHHLLNYDGACANVHGHSYKLQVTVSGRITDTDKKLLASDCMVMDFKDLKKVVNDCLFSGETNRDHSDLNKFYANPTAEVMVVSMFYQIERNLPKDVRLESVKLWETATSFAEFRGEM